MLKLISYVMGLIHYQHKFIFLNKFKKSLLIGLCVFVCVFTINKLGYHYKITLLIPPIAASCVIIFTAQKYHGGTYNECFYWLISHEFNEYYFSELSFSTEFIHIFHAFNRHTSSSCRSYYCFSHVYQSRMVFCAVFSNNFNNYNIHNFNCI